MALSATSTSVKKVPSKRSYPEPSCLEVSQCVLRERLFSKDCERVGGCCLEVVLRCLQRKMVHIL